MAPDSRVFDIFHAMIQRKAFNIIDAGRRAGETFSLCCVSLFHEADSRNTATTEHLAQDPVRLKQS